MKMCCPDCRRAMKKDVLNVDWENAKVVGGSGELDSCPFCGEMFDWVEVR